MTLGDIRRALGWPRATIRLGAGLIAFVLISLTAGRGPTALQAAGDNPIVLENQQPGSNTWFWAWPYPDDVAQQIKGYASASSVNQNENITFFVSVNPAQTYTMDVYRIGWYGGAGARLRLHVGPIDGVQQPACPQDPATGLTACNWTAAYTLTVPTDWTSGVYVVLLTNAQGYQNYIKFVVRDGRPAAFLYQHSVATDQAYNNYPDDNATGKSLYNFNSFGPPTTIAGEPRAIKVSYDRPFADSGSGNFFNWEIQLVRWLERSGYDVTYSTDIDTHTNPADVKNHKAFFSTGHDEYWTKEMYDAVEAARDSGVNLAFFGANAVYTQVRYEPSADGVPNRVMVCYRWTPDPIQGPTTTTEFRSAPVNRPEQSLLGVQYYLTMPNTNYVVTNSSHWVYRGAGFRNGDIVPGIVGYEADIYMPTYPAPNSTNQTLLSQSPSPYTDGGGAIINASSSIYQAPSGAWVFASGTMSWSWALDDVPGALSTGRLDARIQRTTANILNAFLYGAPPTITGFSPASGPVGTVVTIAGSSFNGTTAVSFNGTAASFTVVSDTAIQATVPAGATIGPLSVTNPGGTATSSTNFIVTVRLAVSKSSMLGVGNGTVTSSPSGISCGASCSGFFSLDSVVNLTPATDLPNVFNGWSGCDSVAGTTCTVVMSRARTVTANFLP